MICGTCQGAPWVCEAHADRPWNDHPNGIRQRKRLNASSPALTIAGIWDQWKDRETGEPLKSCAMIITEPNAFVGEVHDRMPVLLAERDFEPWLNGEAGVELLQPASNDLLQNGLYPNA